MRRIHALAGRSCSLRPVSENPIDLSCPLQNSPGVTSGLWMTTECKNALGRRDVVADWKIELRRDRNVILASEFFLGCCSSIPAAHWRNYGKSDSPSQVPCWASPSAADTETSRRSLKQPVEIGTLQRPIQRVAGSSPAGCISSSRADPLAI